MHLSGAVYAETFLKDAAENQVCVDLAQHMLSPNKGLTARQPPRAICGEGQVPATSVFANQPLYASLVDSFSMRSFVASSGVSGHDQFFATFDRFGEISNRLDPALTGQWLDEVATRAADQNEQYLEVMITPDFGAARALAGKVGWPVATPLESGSENSPAAQQQASREQLAALRKKLLELGLQDDIVQDKKQIAAALETRRTREHCGQPNATRACAVEVRVLYQVLRANAPAQVFAQTIAAFEVAAAGPDVVGLNFVQPEDAYLAMSEYHRQMLMLDYLHSAYPGVHIALHAGELAPGLVPPAGLRFHIREAVDLGHAERIGHGVDVMQEMDSGLLLTELADRHIMIEINLTSNDVILGVAAPNHPLPDYLAAHVPVALSTDDEGVSRIDLTHEYTRAALEFGLAYADLKRMARTSLEHTFLPGASLWARRDDFTRVAAACSGQPLGAETPNAACMEFLRNSPHAAQQWELEHRYRIFEAALP